MCCHEPCGYSASVRSTEDEPRKAGKAGKAGKAVKAGKAGKTGKDDFQKPSLHVF